MNDLKELYNWLDERMNQLAENQRETHARLRQDIDRGFQKVNDRLDTLNGKTGKHETDLAVLKDRSERLERMRQDSGIIGALSGTGAAALVIWIKGMLSK
jgi:chromosome segregation ATPase